MYTRSESVAVVSKVLKNYAYTSRVYNNKHKTMRSLKVYLSAKLDSSLARANIENEVAQWLSRTGVVDFCVSVRPIYTARRGTITSLIVNLLY